MAGWPAWDEEKAELNSRSRKQRLLGRGLSIADHLSIVTSSFLESFVRLFPSADVVSWYHTCFLVLRRVPMFEQRREQQPFLGLLEAWVSLDRLR